jgi:hypothetical protein
MGLDCQTQPKKGINPYILLCPIRGMARHYSTPVSISTVPVQCLFCQLESNMSKNYQKIPVSGSDVEILPDTPVVSPAEPVSVEDSDYTGMLNSIANFGLTEQRFAGFVNSAMNSEQKALDMAAEIEKQKDNPLVAALLVLQPESGQKLKEALVLQGRKAVQGEIELYRANIAGVSERLTQLEAKFGYKAPAATVTAGSLNPLADKKKQKGNAVTPARKAELEAILGFMALKPVFTQMEDGNFSVSAIGHEKGTAYYSNIVNGWKF